jgi:hypothetical protein
MRSGRPGAVASSGSSQCGAGHHGDLCDIHDTTAAVSRTDRVITPSTIIPIGASDELNSTRPRVAFSPTNPHWAAGIRIDPEMSLP